MKILPIGVRGSYPMPSQATSCYLVSSDGADVVLDLGSGALIGLTNHIDISAVSAFVITHLHYDHCADALALAHFPGTRTIYSPSSPSERFSLLKNRRNFDVRVLAQGLDFRIGGTEFSFFRTEHSPECYGVRAADKSGVFVYTADTAWFDRLPKVCEGADVVFADCAGFGKPHMTPADGAKLNKLTGADVYATHFMPGIDLKAVAAAGLKLAEAGTPVYIRR